MCFLNCPAAVIMRCSAVEHLSPFKKADSIEHYGRRENVRIFVLDEEPGEDVFAKAVSVAGKADIKITSNDDSTCHRLPSGDKSRKPIIAKFVRRDTKNQLMKKKSNLKNTRTIFIKDDLTPFVPR